MSALEHRIRSMIGRAIVRLVNDATAAQEVQLDLLEGESQDGVERFQNYGFTSVPHEGAEALAVFPAGLRSHAVAIVVEDRRFRLTELDTGEVAMFDDLGNVVKLGRDRIEITGESEVRVSAPKVVVDSSNVDLGGTGGQRVARIGDDVDPNTNKIITGSSRVSAT